VIDFDKNRGGGGVEMFILNVGSYS
jgi:hypothetical protein